MREIKVNSSITNAYNFFFHRDLASTYRKKNVLVSHVMNESDDSVAKD